MSPSRQPVPREVQDLYGQAKARYTAWLVAERHEDGFFHDDDTTGLRERFLDALAAVADACDEAPAGVGRAVALKAREDFVELAEDVVFSAIVARIEAVDPSAAQSPGTPAGREARPPVRRAPGGRPEIRLVLEDVVRPAEPPKHRMGDLFLTEDDAYFVSYTTFERGGCNPLMYVAFGALGGGLFHWQQDRDQLRAAKKAAKAVRERTYGLTLDERVEQFPGSTVIASPRDTTRSMEGGRFQLTSCDGEPTSFLTLGLADEAYGKVGAALAGRVSWYPSDDPYGLLIHGPSPRQLAQALAEGVAEASALAAVASDGAYVSSFVEQARRLPPDEREALAAALTSTPEPFRGALATAVARTLSTESRRGWGQAILLGPLGLLLLALSVMSMSGEEPFWGCGTAVLSVLILGLVATGIGTRRTQAATLKQFATALEGDSGR